MEKAVELAALRIWEIVSSITNLILSPLACSQF